VIKPLGKILVECGFISNMQLSEALIKQKASGGSKRMGDIFLEMGILSPQDLETALKKQQESTGHGLRKTFGGPPPSAPSRAQAPVNQTVHPISPEAAVLSQFRKTPMPPQSYSAPPPPHPAASPRDSKELLALVQLLIKKGVITMEEYFREIKGG